MPIDEALVIEGCRKEQAKAQKQLFECFADAMLLLCIRYVKNRADAEELMLNGFYKFFAQIEKFVYTQPGCIKPWLRKIMVNECLMFLRKKGQLILMDEHMAGEIATNEDILDKLSGTELLQYIVDLPVGYRTVFNLYVLEHMSHKEIAAVLGISEGTSKSQLNRARVCLQNIIKKNGAYHERFR